ncbi:hypothetical protein SK128_020524 [Halocaridina rubra]|uniref:Proton-coupled folate transporter n=1 Tax=Halocaridina rubra TaxID=373956 RepID=A0AAN8ZZ76_HALRR
MLNRPVNRLKKILSHVTVEPVMFLDGMCHWSMQVFMEVVFMNKICETKIGLSPEICSNITAHPEENILVQKEFSTSVFQNSIIMSILPLTFVLFMGAWSDLYGRRMPLILATLCHVIWSGGYLLNTWQISWPLELIYVVTLFDSIGGGSQGLVSTTIAYISDVTPVETRTSRVSTALSLWYFGGPLGNLIGAVAIQYGGINLALSIVFLVHLTNFFYTVFYIKESHGPFAAIKPTEESAKAESNLEKEDISKTRMFLDFFNWRRVIEAFKTALKRRDGYSRMILLTVILSNMLRRAARGFFMYSFVRRSLGWDAAIYSYWTSYRTLIAAGGSLVLVPILTRRVSIGDCFLIVVGSLSLIGEYCCYGFVSGLATAFMMWMGPLAGLISNASIIAHKSFATKLVSPAEKGRVSAVMAATQCLMPMVGYAMYAPIYHKTVETFPEAQYFIGACIVAVIMIIFLAYHLTDIANAMKGTDTEEEETKNNNAKDKVEPKLSHACITTPETIKAPFSGLETQDDKSSMNTYVVNIKYNLTDDQLSRDSTKKADFANMHKDIIGYENKLSDAEILQSEGENGKCASHTDGNINSKQSDHRRYSSQM